MKRICAAVLLFLTLSINAVGQSATVGGTVSDATGALIPGVTVAATKKLIETGVIPREESIVICITGNGLKTPDPLYDRLETQVKIRPMLSAFDRALANLKSQTN